MWVFGYGSLLWNPGFRYSKKEIARLEGYKRSFSMRSIHHRGTAENPGLVLALSRDAQSFCEGLAFEVEQGKEVETKIACQILNRFIELGMAKSERIR